MRAQHIHRFTIFVEILKISKKLKFPWLSRSIKRRASVSSTHARISDNEQHELALLLRSLCICITTSGSVRYYVRWWFVFPWGLSIHSVVFPSTLRELGLSMLPIITRLRPKRTPLSSVCYPWVYLFFQYNKRISPASERDEIIPAINSATPKPLDY